MFSPFFRYRCRIIADTLIFRRGLFKPAPKKISYKFTAVKAGAASAPVRYPPVPGEKIYLSLGTPPKPSGLGNAEQSDISSFPLYGGNGLGRKVVKHAVYSLYFF